MPLARDASVAFLIYSHLLTKKLVNYLHTIQKLVSLHCSISKALYMKKQETIKMNVTPEEEELIKAIRNYCNSYPNGYPDLLDYAEDLFQRMTDMPKD